MEISRDEQFEQHVVNSLISTLSQGREGIHVSDLLGCERQVVLKDLLPQQMTRETAVTFTVGRSQHDIVQMMKDYTAEHQLKLGDITGTQDLIGIQGIVEIKGTRTSLNKHATAQDVAEHSQNYCEQLKSYCAMAWVNSKDGKLQVGDRVYPRELFLTGRLLILYVMGNYSRGQGSGPDLRCWKLSFSPAELESWANELIARADSLKAAKLRFAPLAGDEYSVKRMVEEGWMPDGPREGYEWLCKHCPYEKMCFPPKPMQLGISLSGGYITAGAVTVSGSTAGKLIIKSGP